MTQTAIPNEIISAFLADKCRADESFMQRMQKDSAEALASLPGASVPDINVRTVQNTADAVHIALPHYAGQEDVNLKSHKTMSDISDEDLAQISGGEIIGVLIGIVVASFVAATVIGVTVVPTAVIISEVKAGRL